MTIDERDAEVGRLVRERRELREERQALVSKVNSTAKMLSGIGKALYVTAAPVSRSSRTLEVAADGSVSVSDEYHEQQLIKGTFPTADQLHGFIANLREVDRRLAEVEGHLKAFGV